MQKFKEWVKLKEAMIVGDSPAVQDIAVKAMQSGKLQLKDLGKVMPSDQDSKPATKMMKKK
jgi:hypothetical protein